MSSLSPSTPLAERVIPEGHRTPSIGGCHSGFEGCSAVIQITARVAPAIASLESFGPAAGWVIHVISILIVAKYDKNVPEGREEAMDNDRVTAIEFCPEATERSVGRALEPLGRPFYSRTY